MTTIGGTLGAGSFSGEAHVFELAKAKYLGGLSFSVSGSDSVVFKHKKGANEGQKANAAQSQATNDFSSVIRSALVNELNEKTDGAVW